jgi:hypothetical protein
MLVRVAAESVLTTKSQEFVDAANATIRAGNGYWLLKGAFRSKFPNVRWLLKSVLKHAIIIPVLQTAYFSPIFDKRTPIRYNKKNKNSTHQKNGFKTNHAGLEAC